MPAPMSSKFNILLIAVYGVLGISATGRAVYQLATKFDEAPISYSLSALAAVVYVFATILMVRGNVTLTRLTMAFELLGVLTIGLLSLSAPELFNHATVWSRFGAGYGYLPLALPIIGLYWIRRMAAK